MARTRTNTSQIKLATFAWRDDPFLAVLGAGRGRADANALLTGRDDAGARAESDRLLRQLQAGEFAPSLEVLQRVGAGEPPISSAPLDVLLAGVLSAAVDVTVGGELTAQRSARLLEKTGLRTRYSEYLIACEGGGGSEIHFAVYPERARDVNADVELVCGLTLSAAADSISWDFALRGAWLKAAADGNHHCRLCAAQASEYEEAHEGRPYPTFSEAQYQAVLHRTREEMAWRLPGILAVEGPTVKGLQTFTMHAYRMALSDMAADELHAAGEWALTQLLSANYYQLLLDEAHDREPERQQLADLLSVRDWREVVGAVAGTLLPLPHSTPVSATANPIALHLRDAVRAGLAGQRYFAC